MHDLDSIDRGEAVSGTALCNVRDLNEADPRRTRSPATEPPLGRSSIQREGRDVEEVRHPAVREDPHEQLPLRLERSLIRTRAIRARGAVCPPVVQNLGDMHGLVTAVGEARDRVPVVAPLDLRVRVDAELDRIVAPEGTKMKGVRRAEV